jgi:hypothetical protein
MGSGVPDFGGPWILSLPSDEQMTERMEETFPVGSAPELEVSQFAGAVIVRAGADGTIRVVATKQARGQDALDAISVRMSGEGSRVEIRTSFPAFRASRDATVRLEITVPADASVSVTSGAGSVEVSGVQGAIEIEEGAGGIDVRGAAGPVRLSAGAGGINYEGRPEGTCRFQASVGGITLRIPADADVTVELTAGLGGVHSAIPVKGTVTRRSVVGTIGTGGDARITADARIGGIDLLWQ